MSLFSRFAIRLLFTAASFQAATIYSLPFYSEASVGFDNFRGMSEGSWNGNSGALVSANFACYFNDRFGAQLGGSYGIYDWNGRGNISSGDEDSLQQQGFITAALYKQEPWCEGLQGGIALDWMFNENFGVFALSPNLGQLRLQIGYLFSGQHELGVWGTVDLNTAHQRYRYVEVKFRAVSQVNLFWRYYFVNGAESMIWAGLPYKDSLMFSHKRQGEFIVGANFRAPLCANLYLDAHGAYMGGSGNSASGHFKNYSSDVYLGVTYVFGQDQTPCCVSARPYMQVGNNSNFFVDTSLNN